MNVILCHTTADFDTLGAAVGLTRLQPGSRVVLTGGSHPAVRDFLALHRDEYALIERRAVNPEQIRSIAVVDTQKRDRVGKASEWLDLPDLLEVVVYDHHPDGDGDIPATRTQVEPVGATTTLIAEQLQQEGIQLTPSEATVMALGIHVDTGSLTYEGATARDAIALAWLMEQGASLRLIADYVEPGLSPQLQELLTEALEKLQKATTCGYTVSWVLLKTSDYVPGLSTLATRLLDLGESDALLLAAAYPVGDGGEERFTVIGRSRIEGTNLNELFQPLGGGGHSQAASVTLRGVDSQATLERLVSQLKDQIPQPLTARELMSSPVRTIRPDTTIEQAQRILLRYGHSGLSVVNSEDQLVGIVSRRDIDLALHHGFSHAPVKGYMANNLKTITPNTSLPEIESIMVTYDIGRLPVLQESQLVGMVTRTDVLRQLHQGRGTGAFVTGDGREKSPIINYPFSITNAHQSLMDILRDRLAPPLWEFLTRASQQAEQRGWHLYLVGGGVRDLLLANPHETLMLSDIDLVVDGFHRSADVGAGVELAKALQQTYPNARLEVHGQFQTAALLWHNDPVLDSLWVDIATARTEFYPYPAANPEVEASSIRQDLYRRDFTINALAMRLTPPRAGELLDFFGGMLDLRSRQIRVLHANSFIEDPTRIYRAVRFAVRLGFQIEPQTEGYIRYALESGIYERSLSENSKAPALQTRLKAELKYILQAPYWKPALELLADLGALRCLHPTLELDEPLWNQVRLLDRCLRRFDPQKTLDHWQMRLEILIAYLAPEYRATVAINLQLPTDSIERLDQLDRDRADVVKFLPECQRPSQVVVLLRRYELPTLILIAVKNSRLIRRLIWQYFTTWANIQPILNGNDLKALGYKPGREFKPILDRLLAATLDGEIRDRADAEKFLAEYYPL
ncbi:CBS domain-containing protein [Coleofasciculus sp. FACHB-1120]|uniref:CBS domain-containing protein n=1 Tax=Coleofasciculus sp. FACHB-1120 TaxID=2692783 RepID=UPI0016892A2E|nr:CBS domain-containing protein [Coleofasciculus sp. FACHB-1120]MBD2744248.1 CBS domain-containing protein [Coleofasciculus sp. FACHB-1120]